MGLRERFLTAGVAIPLAVWAIFNDARLCLSLVLVLQAICVQELSELLRRTRWDLEQYLSLLSSRARQTGTASVHSLYFCYVHPLLVPRAAELRVAPQ